MKTLVIHPKDVTTDFLSVIYEGRDWTVITESTSRNALKRAIRDHDRIIMLGHGTEDGLIGFNRSGFAINSTMVYALRSKHCVCIWCNADQFVKRYNIKGFYTGMIISEYDEAIYYSVPTNDYYINKSNLLFADSVKKTIDLPNMLPEMQRMYYDGNNQVIMFNVHNLYQTK